MFFSPNLCFEIQFLVGHLLCHLVKETWYEILDHFKKDLSEITSEILVENGPNFSPEFLNQMK